MIENGMWISYSLKTFRAGLKTFPRRHLAKATLETINVLYIIHIRVVKKT